MTREEAIRVLEKEKRFLFHGCSSDKVYEPAFDMAIEALSQPKKKGKWLKPTGLSNPICSECHSCPNLLFGLTSKFCPNCGAEMEVE